MNKALLYEMDLIPDRGEVIVDPLRLIEPCEKGQVSDTNDEIPEKAKGTVDVIVFPEAVKPHPSGSRRVVSIPRMPKFKALAIIRGDIRAMHYSFMSAGKHSELWVSDEPPRIVAVRKIDKNMVVFGPEAQASVISYLAEIKERGLSMSQATDLVCFNLHQK